VTHPTPIRTLLSVGWGGLGSTTVPAHVHILDNVPHDWLFERVSAVVHHGGAGTTAIGLKKAAPTIVVPFFGDQGFWGTSFLITGTLLDRLPMRAILRQDPWYIKQAQDQSRSHIEN
jgi:sterol 3beta-glucosyltransferase